MGWRFPARICLRDQRKVRELKSLFPGVPPVDNWNPSLGPNKPHPVINLLLSHWIPTDPPLEELVDRDQPIYNNPSDLSALLENFDPRAKGWVPRWYPKEYKGESLSANQRLELFLRHVDARLQKPWKASDSLRQKRSKLMVSLLHIWDEVRDLSALPTLALS